LSSANWSHESIDAKHGWRRGTAATRARELREELRALGAEGIEIEIEVRRTDA
jgi:hypothetical protein